MDPQQESWEIRIKEMDLFEGLDLNIMREIADTACTEATFAKREVIFKEGDPANALYILEQGTVDLKIGPMKTVYSLTEGSDIFGWSSMVENARYTATAIASTNIQAIGIDTRKMNRVFNANPAFGLSVYRRLCAVFNKRLASIYRMFLVG